MPDNVEEKAAFAKKLAKYGVSLKEYMRNEEEIVYVYHRLTSIVDVNLTMYLLYRSPQGKSVKRSLDLSCATPPSPPKKQGTTLPEDVVADRRSTLRSSKSPSKSPSK